MAVLANKELKEQAFKDNDEYEYIRVMTLKVIQALFLLSEAVRVCLEAESP